MKGSTFVGGAAGGSQQHTQYKNDQIHPHDKRAGPNTMNQSWTAETHTLIHTPYLWSKFRALRRVVTALWVCVICTCQQISALSCLLYYVT